MAILGHWRFDESSGMVAVDSSIAGNNGNLFNMAGNEWAVGKINNALSFDGVNDDVKIPGITIVPAQISFAAWVYETVSGFNPRIIDYSGTSNDYIFPAVLGSDRKFYSGFANTVGGFPQISSTVTIPLTTWVHLASTISNTGIIKIYINGLLNNTSGALGAIRNSGLGALTVNIGNRSLDYARSWPGKLDEIWIFDNVLTDIQIKNIYDNNDPDAPLLCWNYKARYKNSDRIFATNGSGPYPRELRIPSSVDISSGIMMDEGKLISPDQYKII